MAQGMARCIFIALLQGKIFHAPAVRTASSIALFMTLSVFLTCLPRQGLVQVIMPVNRPDTEITGMASALIRSIYCDIRVDPVDDALWRRINSSDVYTGPGQAGRRQRIPPVAAFLVTIKSTVHAPIRLDNALIRYGSTETAAMTAGEMNARFTSAAYSRYRFDRMFAFRRILDEIDPPGLPDFDRDTIALMLDFIPPDDSVVKIVAFDTIPGGVGEFTLRLMISAMGSRKNIDFYFLRRDYRTTDREYIRLKEKAAEKNIYDE